MKVDADAGTARWKYEKQVDHQWVLNGLDIMASEAIVVKTRPAGHVSLGRNAHEGSLSLPVYLSPDEARNLAEMLAMAADVSAEGNDNGN